MIVTTRVVSGDFGDDNRLHVALTRALRSDGGSPEAAVALMGKVAQEQIWSRLLRGRSGHHFKSFTEYVSLPLTQGGLGMPAQDVMALLAVRTELERRPGVSVRDRELADYREAIRTALATEIPVAPQHGEIGRGRSAPDRERATLSIHNDTHTGILARLKRDDPDLADAVVRGEITANAAARQKGWRPPRIELRDPTMVAARIREHFNREQINNLITLLTR